MYFVQSGHGGFNLEKVDVWNDHEQKGCLFLSVGTHTLVLTGEARATCLAWLVGASRQLEGGDMHIHAGEIFPLH
jgi:hypothetical protein